VSQLVTLASAQLLLQSRVKTSAWIGAVQLGKISEAASRQIAMYCNRLQEIATHTSSEQEFLNKDCSITLSLKAGDAIHAGSNRQQPVGICLDMGQNFNIPPIGKMNIPTCPTLFISVPVFGCDSGCQGFDPQLSVHICVRINLIMQHLWNLCKNSNLNSTAPASMWKTFVQLWKSGHNLSGPRLFQQVVPS